MSANRMSDTQRRLAGSYGAHKSWAQTPDRTARTENARRAADARFEQQVDPDGVMTPSARRQAAANARAAFYRQLAMRSAAARRSQTT